VAESFSWLLLVTVRAGSALFASSQPKGIASNFCKPPKPAHGSAHEDECNSSCATPSNRKPRRTGFKKPQNLAAKDKRVIHARSCACTHNCRITRDDPTTAMQAYLRTSHRFADGVIESQSLLCSIQRQVPLHGGEDRIRLLICPAVSRSDFTRDTCVTTTGAQLVLATTRPIGLLIRTSH
jgi:hypothetical protein